MLSSSGLADDLLSHPTDFVPDEMGGLEA